MTNAKHASWTIFFAFSLLQFAHGENLKIVAPNFYEDNEGDSNLVAGCCPDPFRFQQVFRAEDFSSVPPGGGFITSFAWRPDRDKVNSSREITLANTVFRFSTTERDVLSTAFSENIGDDETVVRSGTFTVSTENITLPNGTKAFDYITEFETPFFYNPVDGNLLWEWNGALEVESLTDFYGTRFDIVFAGPPGPVGTRFGGYVVEFTFAPRGDFNGDTMLTVEDIDLLASAIGTDNLFFDVDRDQFVDSGDIKTWVHDVGQTWIGDANLDGEFNSIDFVQVFQAGQYEDGIATNSGWAQGDWNGDGEFDSGDLVVAFQDGGYEQGSRVSQAVPEPTAHLLPLAFAGLIVNYGRRLRS